MRKKLLAGVMALALCSTNMPPQTIFAGEFTSGNLEEVTEETPEIFTDEEQDTAKEASEDISVFSPEDVPAFSDETENVLATAQSEGNGEIDLSNDSKADKGICTIDHAGTYNFTSNNQVIAKRIVIQNIVSNQDKVEIHLNNLKIKATNGPALYIMNTVNADVFIYLQGNNELITTDRSSAGLQKDNLAKLTIDNAPNYSGSVTATSYYGYGAGIGGGLNASGTNIYILGGSVTATSYYGAGIGGGPHQGGGGNGSDIYISNSSVTATSHYGAGIGGGSNASGTNIKILGGSVTATSHYGAGIGGGSNLTGGGGGNGSDIYISNSSVTATSDSGADIGGGSTGGGGSNASDSNITINGGSVKASYVPSSPKNTQGKEVYCCTIKNLNSEVVKIDRNSTPWEPRNHKAVDSTNTNLYAWLTGETHTISVGDTTQTYYFDKKNKKFKPITNLYFTFTAPPNLTYDSTPKTALLQCKNENNMGKITLSYYKKGYNIPQSNGAVDAGTYTVKANIAGNDYYSSISDLTDSSWTFTINPAFAAPGYTTQNPKFVPWSCMKISDIPNLLPTGAWKWDTNVNPNQELPVETPITATAIYTGEDANKGNYTTETITYTITREACKHPHTTERYYSSPSCTSSGYSGDTYCTDCGVLISSGYTISAYGHDYDSGVITTEHRN